MSLGKENTKELERTDGLVRNNGKELNDKVECGSGLLERTDDKKNRRRSTRRMSVKEAVAALHRSSLTIEDKGLRKELDENPVCCSNTGDVPGDGSREKAESYDMGSINRLEERSEGGIDGKSVGSGNVGPVEKGGRKRRSVGICKGGSVDEIVKDRDKDKRNEHSGEDEEGTCRSTGRKKHNGRKSVVNTGAVDVGVEAGKEMRNSKKGTEPMKEKGLKKKLLSLTDLTDRRSVLIEPTKCSQVERSELQPKVQKKGTGRGTRKRKNESSTEEDVGNESTGGNKSVIENRKHTGETDKSNRSDDGNRKKAKKGKAGKEKETKSEENSENNRGVKKGENEKKGGRRRSALVNDTLGDEDASKSGEKNVRPNQITQIEDVTTQLNLTKDNSIICSIRETTLSMSMSRAYGEAPSFLQSSRRSVDEFNLSQAKGRKRKSTKRTALSALDENVTKKSSSESDSGSCDGKKARLNSSGHRKLVRPSLVMTSLHSQ